MRIEKEDPKSVVTVIKDDRELGPGKGKLALALEKREDLARPDADEQIGSDEIIKTAAHSWGGYGRGYGGGWGGGYGGYGGWGGGWGRGT